MAGRPANEALAEAKLLGDKTYEGSACKACGETTRYTSSGGCVACLKGNQKAMREALAREQGNA